MWRSESSGVGSATSGLGLGFRLGLRVVNRSARKGVARRQVLLLAPVLALAVATGCGGGSDDNGNGNSAARSEADARLDEQAATKAKQAADRIVKATPDKHLPGPKSYKSVCLRRGDPEAGQDVPPNMIKCHIEAFFDTYRGKPGGYLWSEDWLVPIQGTKLGTPVISGDYRIRNFLREDNKKNCTGRHLPSKCLPQSVGGELPG
jgi:hypothetical protein